MGQGKRRDRPAWDWGYDRRLCQTHSGRRANFSSPSGSPGRWAKPQPPMWLTHLTRTSFQPCFSFAVQKKTPSVFVHKGAR